MAYIYAGTAGYEIDMAKKVRIMAIARDGENEMGIPLKFHSMPTAKEIEEAANSYLNSVNNPPPMEPTPVELQQIIGLKNTEIDNLKISNKVIKDLVNNPKMSEKDIVKALKEVLKDK